MTKAKSDKISINK